MKTKEEKMEEFYHSEIELRQFFLDRYADKELTKTEKWLLVHKSDTISKNECVAFLITYSTFKKVFQKLKAVNLIVSFFL